MKRFLFAVTISAILFSCNGKKEKGFEVNGTITNSSAAMIYLEELPMATMQAKVVDSVAIGKNGKYELQTDLKEATVYNLRLDKGYPFAAVINDAKKITVDVTFSKENKEFPEKYEVKGSPSSEQMKQFMFAFNSQLQAIFYNDTKIDSLKKAGAKDSVVMALQQERINVAASARTLLDDYLKKSANAALTMFELGYYQSTANNPVYQLIPMDIEEVRGVVNEAAAKYPAHTGLAAIKKTLEAPVGLTGTQAPDFELPDPTGKPIKLSSFRGKYLLVDFWASWCKPCRLENPNVVKAWNRFKGKNFAILGVSLDQEGGKDNWTKAIMADKLTWNHVSDLKYWNSEVVPLYKIEGIPFNVLIDPDGKIIGEGLFGQALEDKLAEVLQ